MSNKLGASIADPVIERMEPGREYLTRELYAIVHEVYPHRRNAPEAVMRAIWTRPGITRRALTREERAALGGGGGFATVRLPGSRGRR